MMAAHDSSPLTGRQFPSRALHLAYHADCIRRCTLFECEVQRENMQRVDQG